jgi:3-oxoacyl-[acyl-carrier protein] reductase
MKHVVITGTSRGIGFELVRIFSEAGHKVLALSRNDKPVRSSGFNNSHCFPFDITKAEDIRKATEFVKENWGSVDILINNSGFLVNASFSEIGLSDFKKSYEVNVFGVAALTQSLLPFMSNDGHVLNISSMGGVQGSVKFPGLSAYSSSKGALITLTELLAEEYKETGPSFNVLALGAVQTEMLQEAFPGYTAPVSADEMAHYIFNFAMSAHQFHNGKIIQVSSSTP